MLSVYMQVCGQKPKYNDGKQTFDYCGKNCASKANAVGASTTASSTAHVLPPDLCIVSGFYVAYSFFRPVDLPSASILDFHKVCHQRPKFDDGKRIYEYCGKSCAVKMNSGAAGASGQGMAGPGGGVSVSPLPLKG